MTILLNFKVEEVHKLGQPPASVATSPKLSDKELSDNKVTQLYWALLMTVFYLVFSLMLLQGILTKNASNMLPFFCLQLFDFVLDLLWLFGHLIVSSDINKLELEFVSAIIADIADIIAVSSMMRAELPPHRQILPQRQPGHLVLHHPGHLRDGPHGPVLLHRRRLVVLPLRDRLALSDAADDARRSSRRRTAPERHLGARPVEGDSLPQEWPETTDAED